MKEKIFELRKMIIETFRSINEDVKIPLKSLNPKFDDNLVQLLLFDSGEESLIRYGSKEDYWKVFNEFFAFNYVFCPPLPDNDTLNDFLKDPYDFLYYKVEKIIEKRNLDKKPSDLYFKLRSLYMFENGKSKRLKTFALPYDVLKKIDFSDVSFADFSIYKRSSSELSNEFITSIIDFSELYGVKINPQTIYKNDLRYGVFNGVEFTGSFECCRINGANFSGSKNAIINPQDIVHQKYIDISDCVFDSVIFTGEIGKNSRNHVSMSGSDFSGSTNAIINMKNVHIMCDCNLQDAILTGLKDLKYNYPVIHSTSFKGAKYKNKYFPGYQKYIPIYIDKFSDNFSNTDFCGCSIIGEIKFGNICGASFEGSVNAVIKLGKVEYDENTNFNDALVYDRFGKRVNITSDGRISDTVSDRLNDIFDLPDRRILSKQAQEEAIKNSLIEKRRETIERIKNDLKKLENVEALTGVKVNDLYGKIPILCDVFLVEIDDHYEINRNFLPYLRFLYLQNINFTNVNVVGLDLRKTYASVDPQKFYNKDVSNCIFDNQNLRYDADFTDVNIEGANFDECSDLFHSIHKDLFGMKI